MSGVFVDREGELGVLGRAYAARPGFVVVYGRRRVGKTRLVLEWLGRAGVAGVYYHAVPAGHEVNLHGLAAAVASQLGLSLFERVSFNSLDALLEALAGIRGDTVVVLDEFTYWVRAEPRVAGELQRFIDHILPRTKMLVVVVGSLLGVMLSTVLGSGSPLYGRARFRVRVGPLKPWHVSRLHPWLSREDVLRVYGLFGGIPYYHTLIPHGASLEEVLEQIVLSPNSPLRDEVIFLLRDELQNPAPYLSILEAVSTGRNRLSEISSYTGIAVQHLPRYLSVLEMLGLVERVVPLGVKRRGWYRVRDYVVRTWFRIVRPLQHLADTGRVREAVARAKTILESLMGEVFEDVTVEYVYWLASKGRIRFTKVGRYARRGVEIDLLAVDEEEKTVHAFEAKWSKLTRRDVERIAANVRQKLYQTPYANWRHTIHIVAIDAEKLAPGGVEVHTLDDMPFE